MEQEVRRLRPADIRAAQPYFLSRSPLKAFLRRLASIVTLVVIDVSGVALGLYAALAVREIYVGNTSPLWGLLWEAETNWLPFLALITVLVFWQRGLYGPRERRGGFGAILSSLVLVALLTLAFALGIGHDFTTFGIVPTTILLTSLFIGVFRASYEAATGALMTTAGVRRRVVLVGSGDELEHLHRAVGLSRTGIDYEFVGVLGGSADGTGLQHLGDLSDLPRVFSKVPVDEVLIADTDLPEPELLEIVEAAHRKGVHVRIAPKTTDILMERAHYVPGQGVPLFEVRPPAFAGTDWLVKRAFDVVVSLFVLVVGAPLWIAIALAVKLTSSGPVLYRDRRIGVGEEEFPMFKFRTMYVDAPERQAQLEGANEADGALFKIREDPRITRVGAFLRRFSLDEITEVLNVLRGEMSLVGPRPLPLRDSELFEDWHR